MNKKKFVPCEIDIVLFEQEVFTSGDYHAVNDFDPDSPWGLLG